MSTEGTRRESQRRQVTVLFCDIAGFTAMSEKMDPEEVTAVMSPVLHLVESVIREHGGTVDKYIGDCVMALFGAPHAVEDAPRRALETALEIQRRIADRTRESATPLGAPLAVHIGINSGVVVAGELGSQARHEFTVIGDTVNIASRLRDAAKAGKILVGPETTLSRGRAAG